MPNVNLEDIIKSKINTINELKMTTIFVTNKDELNSDGLLLNTALDIETLERNIFNMRRCLDSLRQQNNNCKESIAYLRSMENDIKHLKNNIPAELIQALSKVDNETSEIKMNDNHNANVKNDHETMSSKKLNQLNRDNIDPTEYVTEFNDCRKTLFTDAEENYYSIEPLNNIEFAKIPKYMINRQTLTNINDFIATINKIIKIKYSLLALGKNGARKKGNLDLYLQLKKEEADVYMGKDKKIFFTADDYQREIKCKLDKIKLNMLTILRHCKRIHELRSGKNVKYEIIITSR